MTRRAFRLRWGCWVSQRQAPCSQRPGPPIGRPGRPGLPGQPRGPVGSASGMVRAGRRSVLSMPSIRARTSCG
jgi:hypothetical protein